MKIATIVTSEEVEVHTFELADFVSNESLKTVDKTVKRVSKKEVRHLAKRHNIAYDESQIAFAKKLFNAYLMEV